jgi:hypothetical protein
VLSGPFQFMTGIGWRGRRGSISLHHLASANTRVDTRGETFLRVGYHG